MPCLPSKDEDPTPLRNEGAGTPSKDENLGASKDAHAGNKKPGAPSKDETSMSSKDAQPGFTSVKLSPSKDEKPSKDAPSPSKDEKSSKDAPSPSKDEKSSKDAQSGSFSSTKADPSTDEHDPGYVTREPNRLIDEHPPFHPLECRSLHLQDDITAQLAVDEILSVHGWSRHTGGAITITCDIRVNNRTKQLQCTDLSDAAVAQAREYVQQHRGNYPLTAAALRYPPPTAPREGDGDATVVEWATRAKEQEDVLYIMRQCAEFDSNGRTSSGSKTLLSQVHCLDRAMAKAVRYTPTSRICIIHEYR